MCKEKEIKNVDASYQENNNQPLCVSSQKDEKGSLSLKYERSHVNNFLTAMN